MNCKILIAAAALLATQSFAIIGIGAHYNPGFGTTLKAGEKVRVGAYNDKWACVRARGVTGFVLRSGLSAAPPKAAADGVEGGKITVVKGTRYAVVARDDAPMYPTWSESDAPVKRLDKGAQVLLGAYNGAWGGSNDHSWNFYGGVGVALSF